jgi:hypothetical protein
MAMNREVEREMNREVERELNREVEREMTREVECEMNREVKRPLNRQVNHKVNRQAHEQMNYCQRLAAQCQQRAQESTDADVREYFRRMQQNWLRVSAGLEATTPPLPPRKTGASN